MTTDRGTWTAEAVRELGLTTDIETAGAVLGIGRSKAYALAKAGKFPVRDHPRRTRLHRPRTRHS